MTDREPDNLVLQLLRDMRTDVANLREKVATKDDMAEIRSEINSLRADVASDLITTRKELSEQIVGLRRAVIDYHSSVIGHGNIIAELEARLRRVEQRLGLDEH
jgi:chromosome segregation ATPase